MVRVAHITRNFEIDDLRVTFIQMFDISASCISKLFAKCLHLQIRGIGGRKELFTGEAPFNRPHQCRAESVALIVRIDNQQRNEALIEKRSIHHNKACEHAVATGNKAFATLDGLTKKIPTLCSAKYTLIDCLHLLDVARRCHGNFNCDRTHVSNPLNSSIPKQVSANLRMLVANALDGPSSSSTQAPADSC